MSKSVDPTLSHKETPQVDKRPAEGWWVGSRLYDFLRSAILSGQFPYGTRIAPGREWAIEYDISISAARMAMMKLVEEGLIEMRQGSGSYVTYESNLRVPSDSTVKTRLDSTALNKPSREFADMSVALLLSEGSHIFGRMGTEIINLLQENRVEATMVGWRKHLGVEQLSDVLARWRERPPRALVLHWEGTHLDKAIHEAVGDKTRMITVYRKPFRNGVSFNVNTDFEELVRQATRHLMAKGHRRIGFVINPRIIDPAYPFTSRKREMPHSYLIQAMGHQMREAGIRHGLTVYYSRFSVNTMLTAPDLWDQKHIEGAVRWLSQPDRPTAVFGEDFRLIGVIQAARKLGLRIPQDLEFLGQGNTPWAVGAGLNSFSLEENIAAREVVRLILADKASLGHVSTSLFIPSRLVIRQ